MFGKKKNRKRLVDEQVRLGFVRESEPMDVSGFIIEADEEIVPGPVPMPEPELELEGLDEVRQICAELSYSMEEGVDDGFVINDGEHTFFYPYSTREIEHALDWLRAGLAVWRLEHPAPRGMSYRGFAGAAFEAVGHAIHQSGGDPWRASWQHARRVLRSLPVSAICSSADLEPIRAHEYLERLMREDAGRWEVFLIDARNGEI